jgi:hypothetical protein
MVSRLYPLVALVLVIGVVFGVLIVVGGLDLATGVCRIVVLPHSFALLLFFFFFCDRFFFLNMYFIPLVMLG